MSKIDQLFSRLRGEGRRALMPFVTAGDPDLEFTCALIAELGARGCHLCEIGFPYSDPIADGPVIQASYTRALEHGIKVRAIFDMIRRAADATDMPLVAMASYAIIYRHGTKAFIEDARGAGMSGIIIPDLPVEEAAETAEACRRADLSLVQLITPTTSRQRALRIASLTTGFIYYVSITGITGERAELPKDLVDSVTWLRSRTSLPICIGFGISLPEHVRALAAVADGLIVGSAIVRRVGEGAGGPREEVLKRVGEYVSELLAALKG
jgi:tryptophan synthase alpha chain